MEMLIAVMVSIALIVLGGMTMSQGFITSADSTALSVEDITATEGETMRTGLSLLSARLLLGLLVFLAPQKAIVAVADVEVNTAGR